MKYLLRILICSLLVSLWLPIFPANAQQELENGPIWLSASGQKPSDLSNQQQVKTNSKNTLDVLITFPGVWAEMQNENGEAFTRIWHEEYGLYREPGQPTLPGKTINILIPKGAQIEVLSQVISSKTFYLSEYLLPATITPAQIQVSKSDPPPPWTNPDPQYYSSPNTFPQNWYEFKETLQMRDYTILPIWINPVRYSPGKGELEILGKIELQLTWQTDSLVGAQNVVVSDSPSFDRLVSQIVINPPELPVSGTKAETREGYLIITPDEFVEVLQPFVDLKENQGFEVSVKKLSEVGQTSDEIKTFIKNEYNNTSPRPTYLLLIGDTNYIPGNTGSYMNGKITDLYYGTMDGRGDYIPEIHIGRLPVNNETELTNMINKLINYTNNSIQIYQSRASFIATCDTKYYSIAENTHNYVIQNHTSPNDFLGDFPDALMIGGDQLYCRLSSDIESEIINRINFGRGLITFSGHGYQDGWNDGSINIDKGDISQLLENNVYSFVASFACQTNDFGSTSNPIVFSETWMLQENKGAISFLGSTADTQWSQDDILEKSFYDYLFESPFAPESLREAMFYGLSTVQIQYPGPAFYQAKYYWESYNLLGDPSQVIKIIPRKKYYFPLIFN